MLGGSFMDLLASQLSYIPTGAALSREDLFCRYWGHLSNGDLKCS